MISYSYPIYFAQQRLRYAGQLVCIDLSFGTAEFISNSANLLAIRSRICAHSGGSDRPRAQNLADFRYNSATPATGARRRLRGQSRDAKTVAKRPRWNDFVRCGQCMLQSLMREGFIHRLDSARIDDVTWVNTRRLRTGT